MSRLIESQTELFASAPISKVIEIALLDLEKIERSPQHTVRMSTWYEQDGEECYVCFAGCVMASTLAECPLRDDEYRTREEYGITPGRYEDKRITKRLRALDLARRGFVEALPAFMDDKTDYPDIADDYDNYSMDWVHYEDDPVTFKSGMKKMAIELRAKGY